MICTQHRKEQQISILAFVKDLPNICSLVGLLCAVLGIYYAILGVFPAVMICMLWAVFFDWADGLIAQRMKGRTEKHRIFGGQLDSLIDIVSFGICPAIFLLSYGEFNPWFIPGAFIIIATGVLRLSYFNVFGLVDDSTYMGLALDNNIVILSLVFLLYRFIEQNILAVILYIIFIVLSFLNLAPIRTPKMSGRWFYFLTVYILVMTVIYGWSLNS